MAWQSLVNVNLNTVSAPGWCLAFAEDAVGAAHGLPTARSAWDAAWDKHWGDYNLPNAVVAVFWSWVGDLGEGALDYGHVCIWVPGQGLFSSPKRWSDGVGNAWYGSIDEVSNWIGGSYLGWTSDLNGLQLAQWVEDAPAAPNQRQVAGEAVNRRNAPNTGADVLDLFPAGSVQSFDGWIHGENVNGIDVWFRSGDLFSWSGAFTSQSTDALADLNQVVTPADPAPSETPETTPVTPEQPTTEEKPMASLTEEEKTQLMAKQADYAASIKPVDLGSIITDNKTRKIVWAVYGLIGLVLVAGVGGLQAINALAPEWFMFILGAYAALGPAFSGLAVANIKTESK